MRIALLSLSDITEKDMGLLAGMLDVYLNQHVCPIWERATIEVQFFKGFTQAPDGWMPLVIVDQPDVLGCSGYHDVDPEGRAYGRAFLSMIPNRVILHDPAGKGASLAGLLAHEAAEMALDILANAYQDGPFIDPKTNRSYAQVAVELCDPVQESAYPIIINAQTVDASNFVYPSWFNRRIAIGKVDYMGVLQAPLTLAPGGYAIVRDTSKDRQVFANLFKGKAEKRPARIKVKIKKIEADEPAAEWREAMKALPGSRTQRRMQVTSLTA